MKKYNTYQELNGAYFGKDEKGNQFIISSTDYERVSRYYWVMLSNGYFMTHIRKQTVYLHRYIMGATCNNEVDHVNLKRNDCRRDNLRLCTRFENACNRPVQKNNESGYKGVGFHKKNKMWRARIKSHGKTIELGYYKTPEEAYEEYKKAAIKIHGEYAFV